MSGSTTPITLTCAGKLETYTVPITGLYTITAYGAQRGSKGAEIGGDVVLTRGEMLQVAVGGRGNDGAGGGSRRCRPRGRSRHARDRTG